MRWNETMESNVNHKNDRLNVQSMERITAKDNFEFDEIEINLTFFHRISGRIVNSGISPFEKLFTENCKITSQDWNNSELSDFFWQNYLEKIVVNHFHIDLLKGKSKKHSLLKLKSYSNLNYKNHKMQMGEEGSISNMGATLFNHGYLCIVHRLILRDIRADKVLELIEKPEFYNEKNTKSRQKPGKLITEIGEINQIVAEELISLITSRNDYNDIEFPENKKTTKKNNDYKGDIPYVGAYFKKSDLTKKVSIDKIRKFTIALGRTTPIFLKTFEKPGEYLDKSNKRNVYGDGNSIVFLARRGWCVYDAGNQASYSFRFGVVEATHLVIMVYESGARQRSVFIEKLLNRGGETFQELNKKTKTIMDLAQKSGLQVVPLIFNRKLVKEWKSYFTSVSQTTAFLAETRKLSPCEDMTNLIDSQTVTHTARDAAGRLKKITNWEQLNSSATTIIDNYSRFLKGSYDFAAVYALEGSKRALFYTLLGVVISIIIGVLNYFPESRTYFLSIYQAIKCMISD